MIYSYFSICISAIFWFCTCTLFVRIIFISKCIVENKFGLSQTYLANLILNVTDYYAVAIDNTHGFPNGIQSHSIVHEPVFPAHEGFVSNTYTGMDELSQIFAPGGGGRNLADSTKSIGFNFPQQHANNCTLH